MATNAAVLALIHGGVVQFAARQYFFKTTVNITNHSITIQGATVGLAPYDNGTNLINGTQIFGTNGVNGFYANNVSYFTIKNLNIGLLTGASVACVGVKLYTFLGKVINVRVVNYSTSIYTWGSTDTYVKDCYLGGVSITVSPFIGIDIDGTSHAQNASVYIDNTIAGGSFSGMGIGYYLHGNRISDVHFTNDEADGQTYGFQIDGAAGLDAGYSEDIFIQNCVADGSVVTSYYVNAVNGTSMVNISDSWGAGGTNGVYVANSSGINITGNQFYGMANGVYLLTSSGCVVARNTLNYVTSNGVYLGNSPYNTVSENVINEKSAAGANAVNLVQGSSYSVISSNIAQGPAGAFTYGYAVAANCDYSSIVANSVSTGSATYPFVLNELLGNPNLSHMNTGEGYQSFTTTSTGYSVYPSSGMAYLRQGKLVTISYTANSAGTSNATTVTMTLPFAANSNAGVQLFPCEVMDNGAVQTAPGLVSIAQGSNIATIYKTYGNGGWTNLGTKYILGMTFTYLTN